MPKKELTAFELMVADKTTFTAAHPDHGECTVDRCTLLARQARDDRWTAEDQPEGDHVHLQQAGRMVRGDRIIHSPPEEVENFRRAGYEEAGDLDDDDDDVDPDEDDEDGDDRLAEIVNDRALPRLAEMGITTYDEFIAAARRAQHSGDLDEFAGSIPYLRRSKVEKILADDKS